MHRPRNSSEISFQLRPDKTAEVELESFGASAAVSPDYAVDIDTRIDAATETKYIPPPLPPTAVRIPTNIPKGRASEIQIKCKLVQMDFTAVIGTICHGKELY